MTRVTLASRTEQSVAALGAALGTALGPMRPSVSEAVGVTAVVPHCCPKAEWLGMGACSSRRRPECSKWPPSRSKLRNMTLSILADSACVYTMVGILLRCLRCVEFTEAAAQSKPAPTTWMAMRGGQRGSAVASHQRQGAKTGGACSGSRRGSPGGCSAATRRGERNRKGFETVTKTARSCAPVGRLGYNLLGIGVVTPSGAFAAARPALSCCRGKS